MANYKAGLQLPTKNMEVQAHIGQFLRTTRDLRAKGVRRRLQASPETALRGKNGVVLAKFSFEHWKMLTWRIGYTTFFDLLGRLRISANHREIERFVEADIDFRLFHQSLANVVSYVNFIHESYVAKAMGLQAYRDMVAELPPHLGFVKERMENRMTEIFESMANAEQPQIRLAA
jgi:hypothetical protein